MTTGPLQKHFSIITVFAFSVAGMLASGLFLLPGMVFHKVGNASVLVYLTAGILILPTLFSKAELATAMPRAGGAYYFIDRSMGSMMGTVAGIGTWLSLIFKSSFDLIGIGAYLLLFITLPIKPVAVGLCIGFGLLAITGSKNAGRVQEILVGLLLLALMYFIIMGILSLDLSTVHITAPPNSGIFMEAVGLVYVSFASLTKVVSVAEEVTDLETNIPWGMFASIGITIVLYLVGILLIDSLVPAETIDGTLTPVADVAAAILGTPGVVLISIAAVLAFAGSANAGLTAASRYPLALSRDKLAPESMKKIGRFGTPVNAIIITTLLMILFVLVLSPEGVAKLASAFLLIIFGFLNLAVIVMRESGLHSYDPGFRSPLYPWMQIIGIVTSLVLIPGLGIVPRIASGGIILLSILWYLFYAPDTMRDNAMFQIFRQFESDEPDHVDKVLRMGLRERGLRQHDTIDDSFYRADILEHRAWESYEQVMQRAIESLAHRMDLSDEALSRALDMSEQMGNTPVGHHIALPHARHPDAKTHEIVIVRSEYGFILENSPEPVYALFVLISPEENPGQHLRLLAEIANRAEGVDFAGEWRYWSLRDIQLQFIHSEEIEEVIIGSSHFNGKRIGELDLPEECIIAFIERAGKMVVPHGDTPVNKNDRIILLGHEDALVTAREYFEAPTAEEPA